MKKLFGLSLAVVLTVFLAFGSALAEGLPSSKAAVAISELIDLSVTANDPADPQDTGWKPILTTYIKTPNQKELAFDVALQCGLVTDTTVKSKGGDKDISQAKGSINVRVKVTCPDGSVKYALPSEEGNSELGVTYCDRLQRLEAKFAGLNCTADLNTGVVTCEDPEELRLLLETLNANAFNFLLANVKAGVHTIEVQARAQADVDISGTELGEAKAEAFVGLGSMLVETIRLIQGAETEFELK